jgi:hydrogenase maturation protease
MRDLGTGAAQPFVDTRIIGLGNTILSDDGAGIYAVREIGRRLAQAGRSDAADIVETEVAGLSLMELITGWKRIILVDSIQFDGIEPGTVIRLDPNDLRTSLRLRSVHDADLPTILALGRKIRLEMPEEVIIFGIQAEDPFTLGECLTPAVERGTAGLVEGVLALFHLEGVGHG